MCKAKLCILLLMLAVISQANIWDNVYSQAKATTPILLDESLSIDFSIREYSSNVNIDFNSHLQLLTATVYFDLLLIRLEVLKAEIDLKALVLTVRRQGKSGCERFKPAFLASVEVETPQINKERMFLLNLFFKFIGLATRNERSLNKYKFEPFLLGRDSKQFQNYTKGITDQLDATTKEKMEDIDFDVDLQLYVYVDSKTGRLNRITMGEQKSESQVNVPFKLSSAITKPMGCTAPIKQLSNSQLKDMLQLLLKSKGQIDQFLP